MSLQHRDVIEVDRKIGDDVETNNETRTDEDGQRWERIEVWNYLNVTMAHQVRGSGTLETYKDESQIERGGYVGEPDYVTEWAAEYLWHEHDIDLDTTDCFDIEVVDIEDDRVQPV